MTTPIIELIAVDIETAINAVTTGSGYNYTLNAVRPKRALFEEEPWDDLDVLITQGGENSRDKAAAAYEIVDIRQQFNIYAIAIESDKASTSIDTKQNKIASDIIKQLRVDPQRSTLAHETEILPAEPFFFNDRFTGVLVAIEVFYRVKQSDPYTQS